jgi:trans-2,3-dihydro-3-hydroxyanthranilate isomerase
MRRRFVTLDVFTSKRFAGNPLAVVLDPAGLDAATMQAMAREFNLAETVFVLPPVDPARRARLRIFTPATELPFAGHPTVGTAGLLARIDGGSDQREIVVEEGIGPVRCVAEPVDADCGRARFELGRLPGEVGAAADNEIIASALGLKAGDIGFDQFKPVRWSAGVPFTFVPIRGLDPIRRCRIDPAHWDAAFGQDAQAAAYMYCRDTVEAGHAFHVRMFAPRMGIPEDPATGSGAAAFAGVLTHFKQLRDGDHDLKIEQGYEMGRPSLIELSIAVGQGNLQSAAIAGEAVVVSEGTIEA